MTVTLSGINNSDNRSLRGITNNLFKNIKDINRPNLYSLHFDITFREFLESLGNMNNQFLINNITLPRRAINKKTINRMGLRIDIPSHINYDDNISVKFYDDTGNTIYDAFNKWMDFFRKNSNDPINVIYDKGNLNKFMTTMYVDQLNTNQDIVRTYEFLNVWPTSLTPSVLDSDNNNQTSSLNVSFAFSSFNTY